MIEFEKTVKNARILNPLKNFQEDVLAFEYRTDPLTGRNTTVIKGMLGYVKKFLLSDDEDLNFLVEETSRNCPFCPESVKTKTPMFVKDFLEDGRIFADDAVVVPNLLGHAERSVLVILSKGHHLKLREFTSKTLLNGFKGATAYLRRLRETEPEIRFPAFIFNYLPPAGSSIFHPHMQVLVRDRPFFLTKMLIDRSRGYYERTGTSYWTDLTSAEKDKERYIFQKDGVEWLVPFAPQRGLSEIHAVINGKSNLLEIDEKEWLAISEGMAKILQFYHSEGYVSFNAVLVSGPTTTHLDYFDVNLRMISRPGIQRWCFTDSWALPYLLWDGEAVEEPEVLASRVKSFLR